MTTGVYAVVTGDIIGSLSIDRERMSQIRECIFNQTTNLCLPICDIATEVVFFRGDGWQVCLNRPEQALAWSLFLRACLLGSGLGDTRISIGIAEVDYLDLDNPQFSMGEAFRLSGRGLDKMDRSYPNIRCYISDNVQLPMRASKSAIEASCNVCSAEVDQMNGFESKRFVECLISVGFNGIGGARFSEKLGRHMSAFEEMISYQSN